MLHPLVEQFRFARSEWLRGPNGVNIDDARRHSVPCIVSAALLATWLGTNSARLSRALNSNPTGQALGTALQRITWHYWYHIGESRAIRQMLGHRRLPTYVGNIEKLAPYRPE